MRITRLGSMFSIQRDGIRAGLLSDATHLVNHVGSEGGIRQESGIVAGFITKGTNRDRPIGGKVYVSALDAGKNDLTVRFNWQDSP